MHDIVVLLWTVIALLFAIAVFSFVQMRIAVRGKPPRAAVPQAAASSSEESRPLHETHCQIIKDGICVLHALPESKLVALALKDPTARVRYPDGRIVEGDI